MNKVIIVGRLGKDPETSTSQSGTTYSKFSLAANDGFGENKKTNWHSCVAFGKVAEIIDKYTAKGNEVAVSGSIDYKEHEGKYYTNILVNDVTLIGGKNESKSNEQNQTTQTSQTNNNQSDDDNLPF